MKHKRFIPFALIYLAFACIICAELLPRFNEMKALHSILDLAKKHSKVRSNQTNMLQQTRIYTESVWLQELADFTQQGSWGEPDISKDLMPDNSLSHADTLLHWRITFTIDSEQTDRLITAWLSEWPHIFLRSIDIQLKQSKATVALRVTLPRRAATTPMKKNNAYLNLKKRSLRFCKTENSTFFAVSPSQKTPLQLAGYASYHGNTVQLLKDANKQTHIISS